MKDLVFNIKSNFKKMIFYEPRNKYYFSLGDSTETENPDTNEFLDEGPKTLPDDQKIFQNIAINLEFIQIKYNCYINNDVVIREFNVNIKDKTYKAFLLYIDGMVNVNNVDDFVLKPLMLRGKNVPFQEREKVAISNNISIKRKKKFNLEDYIYNSLMPQNSLKKMDNFSELINSVNMGNTALFVDTLEVAYNIDLKGFDHRSISSPTNEVVIRGSQEAFIEVLRTNTSLLRRIVNNQNLIIEETNVGKITQTRVAICYIKNITNSDLIAEVKYRVNNLDIDSLTCACQLENFIQDQPNISFPQVMVTERADKAASNLLEGRIVIFVNGSPFALIVPGILMDFLSSPEDFNLKLPFVVLLRFIRVLAFLITILLPGLYIAITSFHEELIPTELLFAIAASREKVPFPIIIELLMMELAFELIREAGLRVPTPIGPTIGIVGALILGEAAVSANLVSPVLIIIVAITAICSFAVPDYSLSFTLRVNRFLYIFLGYIGGFIAIALGIFVTILTLSNLKSFGVPYISPQISLENYYRSAKYLPLPTYKQEKRPDFVRPKREYRENYFSRKWEKNKEV